MTEGRKTREMGYLNFETLHKYNAAIADDPDGCVEKLSEMKERFGITEFALWYNIGGLAPEHAERAMRLTAEKIMPGL